MSNAKFLSDSGWKDIASKNKIKDNGLLKVLADFKKLDDDKHDDALESLDEMLKLAAQLKKAKDVGANPSVNKYVAELADAADAQRRLVAKAKADADKRAKSEAQEQAAKKSAKDDDEDGDDDESPEILTTKLLPLLRLVN